MTEEQAAQLQALVDYGKNLDAALIIAEEQAARNEDK